MTLPWNCYHCGTRHGTPELEKRCARDRRAVTVWVVACLGGIAVLFLAAALAFAHVVYDDWTCAFAECRKVKEIK